MPAAADLTIDWLAARLSDGPRAWLLRVAAPGPFDSTAFHVAFGSAGRKLGSSSLDGAPSEVLAWLCTDAPASEVGRVALLLRAADAEPTRIGELAAETYRTGDVSEKRAVMRALSLLPEPARFVDLAVNACRTSVQPVFEAVACDNPYPAAHFPDASFNQMVLKSLFTGARLPRIVGLAGRATPELCRMAEAYASERRAAGRSVPEDVGFLLELGGRR